MKAYLTLFIMLFTVQAAWAQNNFLEAIQQGDDAFSRGDYQVAMAKYWAAEAFKPSRKQEVQNKIEAVFKRIQTLREEAETAKRKVQNALVEVNRAQQKTDSALLQANKLISAFYFYDGRFALARGIQENDRSKFFSNETSYFYFIDKKGNPVSKLGKWEEANQFSNLGFASVQTRSGLDKIDYLLDTNGVIYKVAYKSKDLQPDIKALDLSGQVLNGFPMEILNNSQLEVLLIPESGVFLPFEIPTKIGRLINLKVLDISGNDLSFLPSGIWMLGKLEELYIFGNGLSELPDPVSNMANLKKLDVSGNYLVSIPSGFVNLEELNASSNNLSELPETVISLANLKKLDISNNDLESIPQGIGMLGRLEELDASMNRLSELPETVSSLANLKKLNIGMNEFRAIPIGIEKLRNLEELDASSNYDLSELPEALWNLTNLKKLDVSSNNLKSIPIGIEKLKNLEELDASWNELSELPEAIWSLINLKKMNISGNKLTSIPSGTGKLQKLEEFILNALPISSEEINKTLQFMPQLNTLYLRNLGLSTLPSAVYELKGLKKLILKNENSAVYEGTPPNIFSETEKARIRERLPACEIVFPEEADIQAGLAASQPVQPAVERIEGTTVPQGANDLFEIEPPLSSSVKTNGTLWESPTYQKRKLVVTAQTPVQVTGYSNGFWKVTVNDATGYLDGQTIYSTFKMRDFLAQHGITKN